MTVVDLPARFHSKQALVGIVGLGYVGLPLARAFVDQGFRVLGFDIAADRCEQLNRGKSYLMTVPGEQVAAWRQQQLFEATHVPERLAEPDALLIAVPTPLDNYRQPDMRYVEATARTIGGALREGQIVVLESTTWPGTTDELVRPVLEAASGLTAGKDFLLAYSPEREDPGSKTHNTATIPKVVGADDDLAREAATALYEAILPQVVPVSGTRAAEATKLLENIFRAVNIALVNELKMLLERMDIDVWEVIRAASTKPFGFMPFWPGPGLGGHCIPVDPFYLTWKAREFDFSTRFIELAGEINTGMPRHVVDRTAEALNGDRKALNGSRVLVLGVAYKPDVDDARESPALELISLLRERGADVTYYDPHIPALKGFRHYPDLAVTGEPDLTPERLRAADVVLIVTNHSTVDYREVLRHATLVVDTRNACDGLTGNARLVKA